MFDNLHSSVYVQLLRDWVEQCPRAKEEFTRRNASGWNAWTNSEFKRWLFAFSKHADISTPRGRRSVRKYMEMPSLRKYFSDNDRWLVSEDYGDDVDGDDAVCQLESEDEAVSPQLRASLEWFITPPAQNDEYYVSKHLIKCQNPPEAVRWIRCTFPFLKTGLKAYDYLACVGYCVAVPLESVRRMLTRWGWGIGDEIVSVEQFNDYVAKLSASTTDCPASISLLFSLAAGSESWRNYSIGGVCHASHPECPVCVLKDLCDFGAKVIAESTQKQPLASNERCSLLIREMESSARPREKLLRHGPAALRDEELLAIILHTGTVDCSVLDLSSRIIKQFGSLARASDAGIGELMLVPGIKEAKATQIVAACEIGKRSAQQRIEAKVVRAGEISDAGKIYDTYAPKYFDDKQEIFVVLLLNTKLHCYREVEVSRGTLSKTAISPREVFRAAIREAAHAVICLHNHPSGDPSPSVEDRKMTRLLYSTGIMVGIPLLDHVILGSVSYYSFREHDALEG